MPPSGEELMSLDSAIDQIADHSRASLVALRGSIASSLRGQRMIASYVSSHVFLGLSSWQRVADSLGNPTNKLTLVEILADVHQTFLPACLDPQRYTDVLDDVENEDDREHLRGRVATLVGRDRGQSLREAISRETRLSVPTWLDLFELLADSLDVVAAVRKWGKRHILEGSEICVTQLYWPGGATYRVSPEPHRLHPSRVP